MSGRGAYYKAKYGGGRGGGGRGGGRGSGGFRGGGHGYDQSPVEVDSQGNFDAVNSHIKGNSDDMRSLLQRIDGRQYPCYKDLMGKWSYRERFTLLVDHVQGDAYASPSRMRIQIPHEETGIPRELWSTKEREIALRDYYTRRFGEAVSKAGGDVRSGSKSNWHSVKGGEMTVDRPGQEVLDRTSVLMFPTHMEVRFTLALPAQGRSIVGAMASRSLVEMLPHYVTTSLLYSVTDTAALTRHIESVEDANFIRGKLSEMGLVCFVANGSILPRRSGASDAPMVSAWQGVIGSIEHYPDYSFYTKFSAGGAVMGLGAVPFVSPDSLAVEITLPANDLSRKEARTVRGMGVFKGVTLICGGGYHGKTTLLQAIESGVYDHIAGDGRELVVTDSSAVKIRAENSRFVSGMDISPFIKNLPYGRDTSAFSTMDASGSTSQAAYTLEALECGARTILLDEDTCATNFMIRDERMQLLVSNDQEPIVPFLWQTRRLVNSGISIVLVIGGCGEYFDVADKVITMHDFRPVDSTAQAHSIAASFHTPDKLAFLAGVRSGSFSEQHVSPTRLIQRVFPAYESDRGGGSAFGSASMKVYVRNKALIQYQGLQGNWASSSSSGDGGVGGGSSESVEERGGREDGDGREGGLENSLELDLQSVEQLVDISQTRAIADTIKYVHTHMLLPMKRSSGASTNPSLPPSPPSSPLAFSTVLDSIENMFDRQGLDVISAGRGLFGNYARPRRHEIAAALNRLRTALFTVVK